MNWDSPIVYAVKHKNLHVRLASSSGGIFTALSDEILKQSGIVYGCILNERFEAIHARAESTEERDLMRGSKYIQSNMGDIFCQVQNNLQNDKIILFSGTSCQIAALKSYLGCDYEKLICVDIVCHGVPSPKVWKKYISWQEQKNRGNCVKVVFRNEVDFGWASHIETLTIVDNNGIEKKVNSNIFAKLFYGHNILRPCCYKCPYKSIMHPGDITIADFWGIERAAPGFSDNKGVSLVLINNDKGHDLFKQTYIHIEYKECRIEDSIQYPLQRPFERPKERDKFWLDFNTKRFSKIVKSYGEKGILALLRKVIKKGITLIKHH